MHHHRCSRVYHQLLWHSSCIHVYSYTRGSQLCTSARACTEKRAIIQEAHTTKIRRERRRGRPKQGRERRALPGTTRKQHTVRLTSSVDIEQVPPNVVYFRISDRSQHSTNNIVLICLPSFRSAPNFSIDPIFLSLIHI